VSRAELDSLRGGGGAGVVLRGVDWSRNPLGPIVQWPLSLQAVVRAMLGTRQATCVFWGPELINLYNDGFMALLGEKHPAAMGQRARDCWSDAWPVVGGLLADVVNRGKAVLFEEMLIPIVRQGSLEDAWWNYSYSPLFDDGGAISGVLVVATETTGEVAGRKQLEAAKLDAELARQELQGVFMQAPLPMALLKGAEHRFTLVNEPYRALVARDVRGRTLAEAFTEEEVGIYLPVLDRVYETGEPVALKEALLRLLDPDGTAVERYIDVGYHPYRDASGRVTAVLAIIHDVTDKVAARLHESDLRKEAEAANRAKDEFLATVSHELRNPLNAILGWSRLLGTSPEPARLEKGLAVIEKNARVQAKLIDDILDVSRIISGKVFLELRRVQLADVIKNTVESIRPAATAKGIRLVLDLAEAAVAFVADEDRLQQIVWNLLSNAVKFTPAGGEVRVVAATAGGSSVSIRVEDTGKGIAAELLPYVFDRFRQGDASTTKRHSGLGLGLAIVRHLVELHGGTVSARSAGENRGVVFEVVLPIPAVAPRAATYEASPVGEEVARPRAATADSLAGVHVLVVDDEDDARELLATVLQEAGAVVTAASSVAAALAVLATTAISVVISDVGMPVEDGYTFLRRLRAEAPVAVRQIPALALTAYARAEDRQRAASAGFQEHAAKPIDPDRLVATVAALVGR
jgi:signal transduction histidine kinase/ActR/RegA family two-component response regulator